MLSNRQGKKLNEYVPDYVVFDLETTGTSPTTEEIIEISAVKVKDNKIVDEFTTLVKPGKIISPFITELTGISNEMVENAPVFRNVFEDFIDFTGDMVLVGHNIHCFDLKFLHRYAMEYYRKVPGNDYIDTLTVARKRLPGLSHHRLSDLVEYYNITQQGAHRALNDCRMNQQVYEYLFDPERTPDVATPSEAVEGKNVCPKCGSFLKKRTGKFGDFYGCTGFPLCRYTKNM